MKFSQMEYTRLDVNEIKSQMEDITSDFTSATDYNTARNLFVKMDKLNRHVATMGTLASIRHSIDTRDEFYDQEAKFWNSAEPEIQEYSDLWTKALTESKFRKELADEFGEVIFTNAELELKSFSPEIIPYLQQENDLVLEYNKLIASSNVEFEGKTYTISQMGPFKTCADDERRLAAWKAEGEWYKNNQAKLDEIYDKLVHLRDKMGKTLGYKDFTQLGYYRMTRNCYTKEDVEKFRSAVCKYLVPVADKIYRRQADRLGKTYPMSFADNALMFRSGNAKPQGTADDIVEAAKKFYSELSPQTAEFFKTMLDGELMDLIATDGKEGGGYCTGIYDYDVPFIFANFNGTRDDVETVTHEAGHAFADWYNRKRVPMNTIWPSLEACEVHSMSMEFFAWKAAADFFGDDERKFYYSHLAGSLTFIPYGTMVDHFQHIVYEKPDMTPAERHGVWKELLGKYMPWMKLDGEIPFYSEGEGWQRQSHIYAVPFYYIDYCLAQTVALEFWSMMQRDYDNAFKHYMAYTEQGGSDTFTNILKKAGLESPFDENCLKTVCSDASNWLDSFNLGGIS
ncbi:MAG: M3 family oligoendopeptidase [Ruminococcaceae bacterium]|nr:M3 family oligoendopeptidase [Oscillospiraceae bacterium]